MCGIAGIVSRSSKPVDGRPLAAMLDALAHRGPDEVGGVYRAQICIGARRLAIVDPLHGSQPFWSDDGSVVAVCNGEIFNYRDLRHDLEASGVKLRTRCDAELVPALYQKYGDGFISKLNAQFAIALYDFRRHRFVAWRDPFGICPLFFSESDENLVFGSEIKSVLQHTSSKPDVDLAGLDQILTLPGPVSPRTMFKGVKSLPPGHRLEMVQGSPAQIAAYWNLEFEGEERNRSDASWIEELEAILLDAVRLRTMGDGPAGLYLSGGIDSSLIGAMLRKVVGAETLDAYSIDFDDSLVSERHYQSVMSDALQARAHVTRLDAAKVWDRLERAVWHTETPLRETFNCASLALSEMVREDGLKMVLAGQGADELFAGYVGYRFDARRRAGQATDEAERTINDRLWGDPDFTYERKYGAFARTRRKLYSGDVREHFSEIDCTARPLLANLPGSLSRLQRRSYVDCRLRLSDHLLSGHGDRMAMANGVEVRYPFLDPRVLDLVNRLPDDLKLNGLREKFIVKELGARWLPSEIVQREKFGFTAPGSPALLRLQRDRIEALIGDERIRRDNIFDVDEVHHLRETYIADGYRIAVPFETDLLITVITYSMFQDVFSVG